ncbi:carotenoid oxygenase family protein [Nostocoides vanveenii]|uniref:carotenoid oxygenase family protein n=1 Tax=Nostocoides vanveenii TaxID=330835 RepID=UPI003CD088D8
MDLPVTTGQLPSFLTGRYLRSGPNPPGRLRADQHWFLGQGMVHGLALEAGRVRWYRNRGCTTAGSARHTSCGRQPIRM